MMFLLHDKALVAVKNHYVCPVFIINRVNVIIPLFFNEESGMSVSISWAQYGLYLQYMALGAAMVAAFGALYLRITPVAELRLIREGNLACALSFGGAVAGFSVALASSITQSVGIADFMLWGAGAALIQILVFVVASRLFSGAAQELAANNVAVGAWLGALSVSIGVLNAACLT